MLSDTEQLLEELCLDLDVLLLLRDTSYSPRMRGWLAATRIERRVRGWYGVGLAL